jgi:hypothetical protein
MERRRAEGSRIVLLTPTAATLKNLAELTALTGGTVKGESEMILRRGVLTALIEARQVAAKIGPVYRAAAPYLRYYRYLEAPSATLRIRGVTLKASDWHPLAAELGAFYETTRRWGWTRQRAEAFLKRAASA